MNVITKADVKKALLRFDEGERPFRFTRPRAWYLVSDRGYIYPLKYIYSIVTQQKPSSFNTSDPIREFSHLGFELKREPKDFESEFTKRIEKSYKDRQARRERLAKAPKLPKLKIREVIDYERNPDVVAEVLYQAKGICQSCKNIAPFQKKSNGEPYLEVHHVKQLAHGGEDTVENAIAICPNCHRKAHHG